MGKVKQVMDRFEEDYELTKELRQIHNDMAPLEVSRDIIEIEIVDEGIIYIKGSTNEIEFWRALRNALIKDCNCNDDWQWDTGAYEFQKELLTQGIFGVVKLALIGQDASDLELLDYGRKALERDYVPIFWCWCHDHYSVNEHVIKALIDCKENLEPDLTDFAIRIPSC